MTDSACAKQSLAAAVVFLGRSTSRTRLSVKDLEGRLLLSAAGLLDPTFNGTGKVTIPFNIPNTTLDDEADAVKL